MQSESLLLSIRIAWWNLSGTLSVHYWSTSTSILFLPLIANSWLEGCFDNCAQWRGTLWNKLGNMTRSLCMELTIDANVGLNINWRSPKIPSTVLWAISLSSFCNSSSFWVSFIAASNLRYCIWGPIDFKPCSNYAEHNESSLISKPSIWS